MDHLLSFGFDIRANERYTQLHQRCSSTQVIKRTRLKHACGRSASQVKLSEARRALPIRDATFPMITRFARVRLAILDVILVGADLSDCRCSVCGIERIRRAVSAAERLNEIRSGVEGGSDEYNRCKRSQPIPSGFHSFSPFPTDSPSQCLRAVMLGFLFPRIV